MPRRNRRIKKATKKRFNYCRKSRVPRAIGSGWMQNRPLPMKQFSSMRYVSWVDIDPGAGGILSKYIFSANGIFDPNISGIGHQPSGFDQLATLYEHYTVVGSKMNVKMYNTDSTYIQICGISVMNDTVGFTGSATDYCEQARTKYKLLSDSAAENVQNLTAKFSTKKFFKKSNVLDEDDLKGDVTTNPTEQAYYHIFASPLQGVDTSPVRCLVTIDYSVVWHEPKKLNPS